MYPTLGWIVPLVVIVVITIVDCAVTIRRLLTARQHVRSLWVRLLAGGGCLGVFLAVVLEWILSRASPFWLLALYTVAFWCAAVSIFVRAVSWNQRRPPAADGVGEAVNRITRPIRIPLICAMVMTAIGTVLLTGLTISYLASGCHKEPNDTGPVIDLSNSVPVLRQDPILIDALLQDSKFQEVAQQSKFQEINGIRLCLLEMAPTEPKRIGILTSSEGGFTCATRGASAYYYVEQLFSGPSRPGEKLIRRGRANSPELIFSTNRGDDDGDPRHIHSLSLSHSGKLLAFMVSSDKTRGNWRNQSLMIYDVERRSLRTVWHGDIAPPRMWNPHEWAQPLPWSIDDKYVLVSTSHDEIISVDVQTGEERDICDGYLPVGFMSRNRLLVLRRSAGWWGLPKWSLVEHDLNSRTITLRVRITGPTEMRAPLISPDGKYVLFVTMIFPGGKQIKGVFLYTLIIRLGDLEHALITAEITAWSSE